ncbi:ABC transporter ATP-binding protein [Arthrobacter sp. zg-Y820]|uniref:dipeptide ABC transporter ATP-binding protein n=1 Tax=Arthrobacter sp. zg-Y820 TaxID=2894192 RepID=UPI0024E040A4|nr:ABC transporter ATP-binding protein [Arthrobacter sp. zg-Y820]WIB07920.1 ABC transporter ATP-binding protein [Arthrobacter sp. zg-Y820]
MSTADQITANPVATRTATAPALEVRGLSVAYGNGPLAADVVHGADLRLERGQTLSLVGQSGSGKSTLALAASGLLPANGRITAGSVRVGGEDVTAFRRRDWRRLRGTGVGYIPQDPLSSLDPLQTIGAQLGQALRLHTGTAAGGITAATIALLGKVGIREPEQRIRSYPHELSGGQLQRVLIAIAIAGRPQLLIADEPTSALDVTVQKRILDLLGELQAGLGLAILFITHDLALAGDRSDALAVLNHGRIVESGPAEQILAAPSDSYTQALFADAPALSPQKYRTRLAAAAARQRDTAVVVSGLVKRYGHDDGVPAAVDGVSFAVRTGSTHALVGESGSGKTTVARVLAGLESFSGGSVSVGGRQLEPEPGPVNPAARQLQLVYQNPLAALDPKFSIRQSIEEPLRLHRGTGGAVTGAARAGRVAQVLDRVGLPLSLLERRPREISGGQRQRVAIARALILTPDILVLDEPTSALDVTVQARIIDLLFHLREEAGLTYLFISHDLSLVRQIADEVSVLRRGQLVDAGTVDHIFANSTNSYTRRLINSIPGRDTARVPSAGPIPSAESTLAERTSA